jgi:hypothetical protein
MFLGAWPLLMRLNGVQNTTPFVQTVEPMDCFLWSYIVSNNPWTAANLWKMPHFHCNRRAGLTALIPAT